MRVRWMRFRHQILPVVTVIACALMAGWLWGRQAGSGQATGEVEARRIPVTSNVEGVLAALPGRSISPHDRVSEGDVIAALDPAPVRARRAARQVEVDRLRAEIQAAEAQQGENQAQKLESLHAALKTREEEVAQLDLALASLDITAPISGTVSKVFLRPGQLAKAGDPIMEISADGASYVVAYLREEQRYIQPDRKMVVEVRPRNNPKHVVQAKVDTVGAQVEAVPSRQLRDQKTPEWGLPVRLAIPPDADLLPGEIVTLVFKRPAS
jgi:multidrug resistance efflux pump